MLRDGSVKILGISAFYHDSAAAIVRDGRVITAAQEERFVRQKHYAGFPRETIRWSLKQAQLSPRDFDYVVFYDKPLLKLCRLIATHASFAPAGYATFQRAFSTWMRGKLFQRGILRRELKSLGFSPEIPLLFCNHHQSHAASAFYPSPFENAAILTMDGVGEWATTTVGTGSKNRLHVEKEIWFPHSLGLLYSAFTDFTGFKVNSAEYKVMGLAPYGEPRYVGQILEHLIDLKEDGSFRMNLEYFDFCVGKRMTNERFARLFGGAPRQSEAELTQREMDLAASIQAVTEEIVLRVAKSIANSTGAAALCLAGGVALNCVANARLRREKIFRSLWIQPAAGDAGGALGAALYVYYHFLDRSRAGGCDLMNGSFLGPKFENNEITQCLASLNARYTVLEDDEVLERTISGLVNGKAIGWFQGAMEFGPRALGNRSIIADPRSATMQKVLNLKVKFRESFRPFAPSVLQEEVDKWFEFEGDSPYMILVAKVRDEHCRAMGEAERKLFGIDKLNVARSSIPAVTHVDYSARLQTVREETNPRYHHLLRRFFMKTGCPILVNTSFNVRGEPIVCDPADAFRCFMGTDLDMLVMENCVLYKQDQPEDLRRDYKSTFELD